MGLLKAARSNTTGLLFFYPLGLLLSNFVMTMLFVLSDSPQKGFFGGRPVVQSQTGMYVFAGFSVFMTVGVWILTLQKAQTERLWPKWTSLFAGLVIGPLSAMTGLLALFFLFVIMLCILAVFSMFYEYPWMILVIGIVVFFMYHSDMKRARTMNVD